MKKFMLKLLQLLLLFFVVAYVFFPNHVDSKYGIFVVFAVLILGVFAIRDGIKAAKQIVKR